MTTATKTVEGTYRADPVHSTFEFIVRHAEISDYKGTLAADATLTERDGTLQLEGSANVESISIREPEEFRAHVLSEEFFDAANHPEVTFRSTEVGLSEDGRARVEGELTIAGKTREVAATGTYQAPHERLGGGRVGLELETSFDRRDYGFDWQMELPGGGNALGWDVTLRVHLELVQADGEGA
jgi:polyisoprenoid-binding protein YceI